MKSKRTTRHSNNHVNKKQRKNFVLPTEWKELPSSLHDLLEDYLKFPEKMWTNEDIRRLAGPLMESKPENWGGSKTLLRIELLSKRPVVETENDVHIFLEKMSIFKMMCEPNENCVKFRTITADDLYTLIQKGNVRLTKKIVNSLVDILKDVASIDIRNSSPEALKAYDDFEPKWKAYLTEHPQLYNKLDPFYVVVALNGGPIPVWPAWPHGRPGIIPAPLNAQPYAWSFPTLEAATFWVGVLSNQFPLIHSWIFDTGATPVHWY